MARSPRVNAYHRMWGRANRKKTAEYNRRWLARNPHKKAEMLARGREKSKGKIRARKLMDRYALTEAQWDEMFEAQGCGCAICGRLSKNLRGNRKPLVVDHDHANGNVRGLLCHNCNLTLGKYDDKPEWFEAIAAYLRKHALTKTT